MAISASSYIEEQVSSKRMFGSSTSATANIASLDLDESCHRVISVYEPLFDYLEPVESGFVDGQSEPRNVVIEVDVAVLCPGFTLEGYQNSSLPTSTSTTGKYSAIGEFKLAMTR